MIKASNIRPAFRATPKLDSQPSLNIISFKSPLNPQAYKLEFYSHSNPYSVALERTPLSTLLHARILVFAFVSNLVPYWDSMVPCCFWSLGHKKPRNGVHNDPESSVWVSIKGSKLLLLGGSRGLSKWI